MDNSTRRSLFDAARKFIIDAPAAPRLTSGRLEADDTPPGHGGVWAGRPNVYDHGATDDTPPRLTSHFLETTRMARSRERIMTNLDEMYREAFTRAQASGDDGQMATLDFAYRREQLYFEILLDIREAVEAPRR